jgi:hypothetical protein
MSNPEASVKGRTHAGMTTKQNAAIQQLVERNPCQMTVAEYSKMYDTIIAQAPCRLLVFGVGNDTPLWCEANDRGTTVFVEDSQEWIAKVRSQLGDLNVDIRTCSYISRVSDLWSLIYASARIRSMPEWLRHTEWNVIIIDGPMGYLPEHPGRLQPIAWASQLANEHSQEVDVFVHDSDRLLERLAGLRFFGATRLSSITGRLAHFRAGKRTPWRRIYDAIAFAVTLMVLAVRKAGSAALSRR